MSLRTFRENPGIQRFPTNEQEWKHWVNEVAKWIADTAVVTTLQSDVIAAARTSVTHESVPAGYVWRSTSAGAFPAGNPTFDITTTFYDEDDTSVATRVLRGTLTTAAGTVAVTNVSSSASTGYSTAYALTNDGTDSVLATLELTLPDSSTYRAQVSWNAMDMSVAGGTPATGGGK